MKKAYCVKCRKMENIVGPKKTTLKNGRAATTGKCKCGTKMFRIGG